MANAKRTIEAGTQVKFQCAGMIERFGMIVEREESKWGISFKILCEDGEEITTNEIREPGETSANGSPLGCYFLD